jgi:predicted molibdopterin-dependent oxidoreductase YjgC
LSVVKLNLDGREIEAAPGAPLVEVIKQNGTWISNLCYIDGLPPYAGCRTCLVEIEGARGLQLACTSRVAEGMVVRTDTAAVTDGRQAVLSIINANHSDRCLTCHRRVHCMPGDICLRDDSVTHRCLTCAKNYRCELQTTNEMLHMANYEPWLGEERTYYEAEQPEADRANPFLEFDPQMCIICTRCVRACDEIRHTGAITLAGRGFSTRIAFGAGGAIHESNCDFCGACIDVCPTATLLEKPNKWIARTETWVSTTCNSCSVGCTLSMGVRNGRVIMVKPDRLNPVSDDQICVRGRFHYDAIKPKERLTRHLVRQGAALMTSPFEQTLEGAAAALAGVVQKHGSSSVGFLVGPWATNEEAYLARKFAREVVGTESIDSTAGPVARAVSESLRGAFGTDVLPADLSRVATADTILVIAEDLESSHNVAALRVKDAVVRAGATLVVISSRYGEVCDFIEPPPAGSIMPSPQKPRTRDQKGVWLRPSAGGEIATAVALAHSLFDHGAPAGVAGLDALGEEPGDVSGVSTQDIHRAATILERGAHSEGHVAIIYAPNPASPSTAREMTRAVANLALLVAGNKATESLYIMPPEINVNGIVDMGVSPGEGGVTVEEMPGKLKALVVVGDNPLMHTRQRDAYAEALPQMECVIVVDSLQTDTARQAHFVFADLPTYAKEGTFTNADRRVGRLARAESSTGDQRDCLEVLAALARDVAEKLGKSVEMPAPDAASVMAEASGKVAAYAAARHDRLESGKTRALGPSATTFRAQTVRVPPAFAPNGRLLLTTARTLYTSLEGASIRSPEADKLHREEFIEVNPLDAAALGLGQNRPVIVANGSREVVMSVALTDAVPEGAVFIPLYYEHGLVNSLIPGEDEAPSVTLRPAS